MKKGIFVIVAAALLATTTTSAVASDFCEVPKWLKKDTPYVMVLGHGQQAQGSVVEIDKKTCWIVVEDRSQNIRRGIEGPGMRVNVNIRQIVSAMEKK